MRIYSNFSEALNETQRDLSEMGVVHNRWGWQGKSADDRTQVKELRNYGFTVQQPKLSHLPKANFEWCNAEFEERVNVVSNPGNAWKLREEVWRELLEQPEDRPPKFAYTYGERLNHKVGDMSALWWLIEMLRQDPTSRRAFLPVFFSEDIMRGQIVDGYSHRVPCTLGYNFLISDGGKLNITYLMRSSDFTTHFQNDLYLATKLQYFVTDRVAESGFNLKPGEFTFFTNNLHVFARDVEGTF